LRPRSVEEKTKIAQALQKKRLAIAGIRSYPTDHPSNISAQTSVRSTSPDGKQCPHWKNFT
jgi:hypothetical protein